MVIFLPVELYPHKLMSCIVKSTSSYELFKNMNWLWVSWPITLRVVLYSKNFHVKTWLIFVKSWKNFLSHLFYEFFKVLFWKNFANCPKCRSFHDVFTKCTMTHLETLRFSDIILTIPQIILNFQILSKTKIGLGCSLLSFCWISVCKKNVARPQRSL